METKAVTVITVTIFLVSILTMRFNVVRVPSVAGEISVDAYTLALWHFDEGEGQIVYDESPHHNDGTLGPTSSVEDRDPSWVNGFTGMAGDYALSFDDWYDYVLVPDNPDDSLDLLHGDQFTIEFWTYVRQVSRADRGNGHQWNRFINKPDWENNRGYDITQCSDYPRLSAYFYDGSGPTSGFHPVWCGPTPTHEWLHFMFTYNGQYLRIYFNGVLQNTTEVGHHHIAGNDEPLSIGKSLPHINIDEPWHDAVDCIIDEVRISSIAREPTTIIYVDPTCYVTAPFYQDFTVGICIQNVTDLFAWEARVQWDPQLLDLVNVTEGDFLTARGQTIWDRQVNQSGGWIFVSSTNTAGSVGMNGSGCLFNIIFHSESPGERILNISDTRLFDATPVSVPTPPYLGDVNGDLTVNMLDTGRVAEAWLTSIGHPRYDPDADFDGDGFVSMFDILCVAFNFQRVYEPGDEALKPVEIIHEAYDGLIIIPTIEITNTSISRSVTNDTITYLAATVLNKGDGTETFDVSVLSYDYKNDVESVIGTKKFPAPGEFQIATFRWDTAAVPLGKYRISFKISMYPDYRCIAGNVSEVPSGEIIPDGIIKVGDLLKVAKAFGSELSSGIDINWDGSVDEIDISIVAWAVGSYYDPEDPHPRWNPDADLNGDSAVDQLDVNIVAAAFGTLAHPRWNPLADLNYDGHVNIRDLFMVAKSLQEEYPWDIP